MSRWWEEKLWGIKVARKGEKGREREGKVVEGLKVGGKLGEKKGKKIGVRTKKEEEEKVGQGKGRGRLNTNEWWGGGWGKGRE